MTNFIDGKYIFFRDIDVKYLSGRCLKIYSEEYKKKIWGNSEEYKIKSRFIYKVKNI